MLGRGGGSHQPGVPLARPFRSRQRAASRSLDALYEGAPAILPRSAERNEIITAI